MAISQKNELSMNELTKSNDRTSQTMRAIYKDRRTEGAIRGDESRGDTLTRRVGALLGSPSQRLCGYFAIGNLGLTETRLEKSEAGGGLYSEGTEGCRAQLVGSR